MWKAISALMLAGAVAAAVTLAPGLSEHVSASTPGPVVKSDRLDSAECGRQSWPYYPQACLKDLSRNAGRATPVRLVSADRLPGAKADVLLPEWAAYLPASGPASPAQLSQLK